MKTKYDDANKAFNPWIWTQTLYANQVWICLTHYKGKYKDIYNLFTPPPPLMCDHVMIWLPPPPIVIKCDHLAYSPPTSSIIILYGNKGYSILENK